MFNVDKVGRTVAALAATAVFSAVFMLGALAPSVGHIAAGTFA